MGNTNTVLNGHRASLSKAGKKKLDEFVENCLKLDISDSEQHELIGAKIKELLIDCALPDILLIDFDDLVRLNRFPRCPDDRNITYPLKSIDRDNSLFIFISHCWMRGHSGAEGWDGRPHPDNAHAAKYKLCVKGIELMKRALAPKMKKCYVWLDFGCINQDGNPAGELEQLDKIVQCCDVVFTPIVDPEHENWILPTTFSNILDVYKAKLWNGGPNAYLNRGWCRVEMLYAANIPILENQNVEIKRHTMFEAGLAHHCSQNRRPHFLYGTKEAQLFGLLPRILPPLQHSYLTDYHPLKGNLSVASDVEHIENLIAELQPYMDANQVKTGYEGDTNEAGQHHGYGIMRFSGGEVYEGEFKNGVFCGRGMYCFPDGEMYEGEWFNNFMHGQGTFKFASGSTYQGAWVEGKHEGFGVYRYAAGDVYEGQWKNGDKNGAGKYTYADGTTIEAVWVDDVRVKK